MVATAAAATTERNEVCIPTSTTYGSETVQTGTNDRTNGERAGKIN